MNLGQVRREDALDIFKHQLLAYLVFVVLRAASVNRGQVYISKAGSFPCKAILHVNGEKDAGTVEQLVIRIIECCEHLRIKSVAIPAICAGK